MIEWETDGYKLTISRVGGGRLDRNDLMEVRKVIERSLREPRYEIFHSGCEIWQIVDTTIHRTIMTFFKEPDFDAREEATKFCKKLNEGC
jgi:hypothetical protein